MKIALFGATGKTGVEVVKQALEAGYEVNAFVRDPSKLSVIDAKLKTFIGDVINPDTFGEVLVGIDAVVITLSGLVAGGIKDIISDMELHNVKKIILMSSYPMCGTTEGMNYLKSAGMDQEKINSMMPMINDKTEQEKLVQESGLSWVIVRPTFLKDEPKTGAYSIHTENVQFEASKNGINRADVADFILKVLETNDWDNKITSISF